MAIAIILENDGFAFQAPRDQRAPLHFPIERELRFRTTGKRDLLAGSGTTIEIGSKRILFRTEQPPTSGRRVEMSISWPVQLDHKCALKLIASGTIMRAESGLVDVSIEHYEFRTLGAHGLRG